MDGEKLVMAGAILIGVLVAFLAMAIVLLQAGLEPLISVMGSLAGVVIPTAALIGNRLWPNQTAAEAGTGAGATPGEGRRPQAPMPPEYDDDLSEQEFAERLLDHNKYKPAGKRGYPNWTAKAARLLKRGIAKLPIGDRGLQWGHRSLIAIAVLCWLWMVMIALRIIVAALESMVDVPDVLELIIYAVEPPLFADPITNMIVYIAMPTMVFGALLLFFITRDQTTCPDCGESFARKSEGNYYTTEGKTPQSETIDGETESWHEYDGWQVLHCTECGRTRALSRTWTDR